MPSYPSNFVSGAARGTTSTNNVTERFELRIGQQTTVASAVTLTNVRVATTAALAGTYNSSGKTFTAGTAGTTTIDGIVLASGNRILFKNQGGGAGVGATTQNGIYTVTTAGGVGITAIYTRATDFDADVEIYQDIRVSVTAGTVSAGLEYYVTTDEPIVLDTTQIIWAAAPTAVQIPSAANYPTDNTVGVADITNSTDVLGNFARSLQILNAEISTYNTAFTALEALAATQEGYNKSWLANLNSGKINKLRNAMLMDAFRIKRYSALMNLVSGATPAAGFGTANAPTFTSTKGSRYPSGWYRGWTA
jgi:hypothetical protein